MRFDSTERLGDSVITTRSIRVAAVAALLSTGLLTGGILNVTSAGAAAKPKLVVTPTTGLLNKKFVMVSGTGFKPKDMVYITECQATAKGEAQCDINTATPVTISKTGVLAKTKFKVVTGTIGLGKCGTLASNLKKCAVSVGNIAGKDTATVDIVFALPKK
jgi:hypothetical protein